MLDPEDFNNWRKRPTSLWLTGEILGSEEINEPSKIDEMWPTYSLKHFVDVYQSCCDITAIMQTMSPVYPQTILKQQYAYTYRLYRGAMFDFPFDAEQAVLAQHTPHLVIDGKTLRFGPRNRGTIYGLLIEPKYRKPIIEAMRKFWPEISLEERD